MALQKIRLEIQLFHICSQQNIIEVILIDLFL